MNGLTLEAMGAYLSIITTVLVPCATAYLRLFVQNQNHQLKEELLQAMRGEFISKDVYQQKVDDLSARLGRLEGAIK